MRTIRIDDEVWQFLQRKALPFVDTPNDVLRRLLLHRRSSRDSRRQVAGRDQGGRTNQRAFRGPILEALVEMGGSGRVADILDRVHEKVKDQLTLADRQQLKTGETRWRNTAAWERLGMVKEGLLSDTSPKGVWEITQKGRDWLKSH